MRDIDRLLDGPGGSSATTLESDESNGLIMSRMKALEAANRHQHQKDMSLPQFFGWLLTRSSLALNARTLQGEPALSSCYTRYRFTPRLSISP